MIDGSSTLKSSEAMWNCRCRWQLAAEAAVLTNLREEPPTYCNLRQNSGFRLTQLMTPCEVLTMVLLWWIARWHRVVPLPL